MTPRFEQTRRGWQHVCLLIVSLTALEAAAPAQAPARPGGRPSPRERALTAFYTFDEGRGETLIDHSGNGHHGKIHGATYVKSPRGTALRFNGVDSFVDLGNPPSLNLRGNLTLAVWLKTFAATSRNRLIYGDTAGLSVDRNFSIRLDRDKLFFEFGDGVASSFRFAKKSAIPADLWRHLAVVLESPRYYIYLDGTEIERGEMLMSVVPTAGAPISEEGLVRRIGGWAAGYFKGEMDELRLYNRALTEREILGIFEGKPVDKVVVQPQAAITPRLGPYDRRRYTNLHAALFCKNLSEPGASAEVLLTKTGHEKPLRRKTAVLREARPGSEGFLGETTFAAAGLPAGEYLLTAHFRGSSARAVATATAGVVCPEKPAWFGSEAGRSDEVPPPWTPVSVANSGADCTPLTRDLLWTATVSSQALARGQGCFHSPGRPGHGKY